MASVEEETQDFSKLSLDERCTHKNWKARVSAYDELTKTFQRIEEDKEWGKYGAWVRKFPTDSNAAAQEKALEVTLLYLENAVMPQGGRIVAEVMHGVVGKCITAGKAKSRELAMSISLMCVEIEKFEAVQEELMKGMEHKNPKVVAGCVNILTEVLRSFGPKTINIKLILKRIPGLIEDRDKTVREETKKLMVELYRWLGPAFKPQLSAVKPLVVQEVEAEVEKYADKPQQTRFLRSQKARQERAAVEDSADAEGEDGAGGDEVPTDIDPYDLLDPVDILSKLPKDFYEKCESKKWQERKEAMEVLEVLLGNPKLETGDYSDLVRMLKKIIAKDSNVVVVALAGKCVAGLANGLKRKFFPYAASCISTILEKFKEKKSNVLTAMRDAIDACFAATSLESIQEDTVLALQNKNPAVKLETNAFLARAFAKTSFKVMSDKKLMKPYFTAILVNLNESDASVREAAAEALGVAMKHLGEKILGSLTADLEPIKLQKVKEFAENAVITAPKAKTVKPTAASGKPLAKPTSKPNLKKPVVVPKKAPTVVDNEDAVEKPKQSSVKVGVPVKTAKAPVKSAVVSPKVLEDIIGSNLPINNLKSQRISDEMRLRILKWNFTSPAEEFIMLLKELMEAAGFNQTLIFNMFHSNFKLHLKALDTLQEEFNMKTESTKCNLDLIMKWATIRFFDTNPSVLIRILEYLSNVFEVLSDQEQGYSMSDVEASAFIPYLVTKLGESKESMRTCVHTILRLLANIYSTQRIFCFLIDGLKSKNSRQRTDCLDESAHMIEAHGINVMMPSPQIALKEMAKQISDRDTNVRNAALNAIVQVYFLQGDKVYKMIGALADKDQSLLEERIKRAGKTRSPGAAAPSPPKMSAIVAPTARVSSLNFGNGNIPDEQIPLPGSTSLARNLQSPNYGKVLQQQNLNFSPHNEENPARISTLPEKYRIDFDAIDRLYDNTPMPPLVLLDTNIDFLRDEQITLPQRRTPVPIVPTKRLVEKPKVPQEAHDSIDLVISRIGDSNVRNSVESLIKLEKLLLDPETSLIMAGRIDTLLSMISVQMRRQQAYLKSTDQEKLLELNRFFRSTVSLLTLLFKNNSLPKQASKESLRDIIYRLLGVIIDEDLENLEDAVAIIRLVNIMVVRIIENSEPNSISCALIRLLNDTISASDNSRMLELVMKCQWKLLKQHNTVWAKDTDYVWDVKAILTEYHSFIMNHSFASFQNQDGTPLKTIKTIIYALIMQAGYENVQQQMSNMPELRDSEGGHYVNKIIQRELGKKRSAPV